MKLFSFFLIAFLLRGSGLLGATCPSVYSAGQFSRVNPLMIDQLSNLVSDHHDTVFAAELPIDEDTDESHFFILLNSSQSRSLEIKKFFERTGNEDSVLFAKRGNLVSEKIALNIAKIRNMGRIAAIGSVILLFHELLNPGVLPNSLPMIPALVIGLTGGKITRNLMALKRSVLPKVPESNHEFATAFFSFIKDFRSKQLRQNSWLRSLLSSQTRNYPISTYFIHLIDVGEFQIHLDSQVEKNELLTVMNEVLLNQGMGSSIRINLVK